MQVGSILILIDCATVYPLYLILPHIFSKLSRGNLIDWDDSTWILDSEMVWIEKDINEICLLPQPKDILFPEARTNADFHLLCNKLRGHLSVSDSQSSMNALIDEFKITMPEAFKGYQSCKTD